MKEFFCGSGTVLGLECGGRYANLYAGGGVGCMELLTRARTQGNAYKTPVGRQQGLQTRS